MLTWTHGIAPFAGWELGGSIQIRGKPACRPGIGAKTVPYGGSMSLLSMAIQAPSEVATGDRLAVLRRVSRLNACHACVTCIHGAFEIQDRLGLRSSRNGAFPLKCPERVNEPPRIQIKGLAYLLNRAHR